MLTGGPSSSYVLCLILTDKIGSLSRLPTSLIDICQTTVFLREFHATACHNQRALHGYIGVRCVGRHSAARLWV